MSDKKTENGCVEPNVELAIVTAIEKKLGAFRDDIIAHMDLKINPIEKTVDRHTEDIKDLYDKDREMRDRVGALEQRQANDEGDRSGRDKATGLGMAQQELTWGKVGIIVAIFSAITGLIVYFI